MRLPSTFAALFLISFFLHDGADQVARFTAPQRAAPKLAPADDSEAASERYRHIQALDHFDFSKAPPFANLENELKNLVKAGEDRARDTNNFCAIGYTFSSDGQAREVLVHWIDAGLIYRWSGGDPELAATDPSSAQSLIFSTSITLDRDLITERTRILSSTQYYKEDIDRIIADCREKGRTYVIAPLKAASATPVEQKDSPTPP